MIKNPRRITDPTPQGALEIREYHSEMKEESFGLLANEKIHYSQPKLELNREVWESVFQRSIEQNKDIGDVNEQRVERYFDETEIGPK